MSTPSNLAIGQLSTTTLTSIYTAAVSTTIGVLRFTNETTDEITISIYHNDGSTDYLQKTLTLPGGVGQDRHYWGLQQTTLNAGHIIKIQASSTNVLNYSLSGYTV